jgi:hypothetical protein
VKSVTTIFIVLLSFFSIPLIAMQSSIPTPKGVVSLKLLAAQKVIKDAIPIDTAPQELKEYLNFIHESFDKRNAWPDARYEYILFDAIKADFIELIPDLMTLGADIVKNVGWYRFNSLWSPCTITMPNAIEYADIEGKTECAELLRQIAYKNGHPLIERCKLSTLLNRAKLC